LILKQRVNRLVLLQKQEVVTQREIIEEKNRNIMDSIHYAKRIQDALLKQQDHITVTLPEHFVLFIPKDVISGDFYWSHQKGNYWFVAAADCTGHGVPGAMMSMLGIAFLNEITSEENILTPAQILNRLRNKVIKELGQESETHASRDGMDISLMQYDLDNKTFRWAGANNPLWIVRNNNVMEIKPDKQPIGIHPRISDFNNHEVSLLKGDIIYLLTDGFADQFGGSQGKKFKYKKLKESLLSIQQSTMSVQKEKLNKVFQEWKGDHEQTDDLTLIGIRI
jgi:serine phosphatase RsbU (regulator of sigma subunit)